MHDHDKTFYRYGTKHQECTQHDCRYLIGSEQNEPQLEWNKEMHGLFQEMLHYRNGLGEKELDPIIVEGFEKRYDEILNKAEKEYQDELRSQESLNDICDGLSIVYLLRSQNVDVYQKISEIYERKHLLKIKQEKVVAKA